MREILFFNNTWNKWYAFEAGRRSFKSLSYNILRVPTSRNQVTPEIKNPSVLANGEFEFQGLFLYRHVGQKQMFKDGMQT